MTRTGLSARLMRHAPEPRVEVHPQDAAAFGLIDGTLAEIETAFGRAVLLARITDSVRSGEIFAPMHWTDDFAPHARANALVNPKVDPISGQPEFKYTPARIAPLSPAWRGFLVTRARKDPPRELWWRRIPQDVGQLYEIAAPPGVSSPAAFAATLFDDLPCEDWIEAGDVGGDFLRRAALQNGRLERALFITKTRGLPARDWLIAQLAAERIDDEARRLLLAGGACGATKVGPSVCACFNVTRAEIETFAAAEPGVTVARVGAALKAGSNCGSCKPEIAQILAATKERTHVAA